MLQSKRRKRREFCSALFRNNRIRSDTNGANGVKTKQTGKLKDGATCKVIGGVHAGKSGVVGDIKTGKTGHVSITVVEPDGERFKTLAKNVEIVSAKG